MRILLLTLLAFGGILAGQDFCAPSGREEAALRAWRENSTNASISERRRLIDELAANYPASYQIHAERIGLYRRAFSDAWPGVRESYVKLAEKNSSDPLSLTLAAAALHRSNTPRAIELLIEARTLSPGFPWTALKLAEIYQGGKFEDKDKARANLNAYAASCAEHLTSSANFIMGKIADDQSRMAVAKRLRARLDTDRSPSPVDYEMLWSLEFRSRPPAEHPALRKQVAKDVERLIASKPDKRYLGTLLAGLKQSGASKESIAAFEDRVLKETPASGAAYTITYERWKKDHKEPEDQKDTAAWDAWKRDYRVATKQWAAQFHEVAWLDLSHKATQIKDGELTEQEAIRVLEESIQKDALRNGPNFRRYASAADTLLTKRMAPAKALEWMEKTWALAEQADKARRDDDTLTDARRKEIEEGVNYRGNVAPDYLRALRMAGAKSVPASLRAFLEGPMPPKKSGWTERYRTLALLALVEGHQADALAYYQQALFTREKAPQYYRGRIEDSLEAEAKKAFLAGGGTEKAFALWWQPPVKAKEPVEGRWEKPKKPLPPFELADTSGKTWRLAGLRGKTLLISLWATWCSYCRLELPHLQKLYEKVKDRQDVQVMSFNVDEELGLVEPFMKDQGLTFPALAAYGFVRDLLDNYTIPQVWLVDPNGKLLATQIGFDSADTDWVNSMLARIDAAKRGEAPAEAE